MTTGLLVFQSDFGKSDGAVSAMHGVANSFNAGFLFMKLHIRFLNIIFGKHLIDYCKRLVIGQKYCFCFDCRPRCRFGSTWDCR